MSMQKFKIGIALIFLSLAGCAETQFLAQAGKMWGKDDVNAPSTQYKVGKPYNVEGKWYYPKEQWDYREEGLASWYGDEFHGRRTANGDVFDKTQLTAAHRTLPMPSLIRVTNLDNGRSAILRVNDRGPFSKGRILDVSHESARVLGFDTVGTARVRVELLAEESRRLAEASGAKFPDDWKSPATPNNNDRLVKQQTADATSVNDPPPLANKPFTPIETEELPPPGERTGFTPPPDAGAAKPIKNTNAPTEPPANKPLQMPSPLSKPATAQAQSGVFVQVGSFGRMENVDRLKGKLKDIADVQVSPLERGGKTLYRVRLGPIESMAKAEKIKQQVGDIGINDAKIITE